jgi:N-acetylated-alpha-linked acidic dipeptidase
LSALPASVVAQSPASTANADAAKWEAALLAAPSPERARATLRTLTAKPHLAGTPEDYETAVYVRDELKSAGIAAEITEYQVWLPYPKSRTVEMLAPEKFVASLTEPTLPEDKDSGAARAVPTFAAYSPSGDVTAEVVYANYGLPEDYRALKKLGVDVKGKIALVRYGNSFRGVKAKVAEENGAAALLIYSDPFDDGYVRGDKYPNGPYRTDNCVQRGSVGYIFQLPGDPLTPGTPSVKGAPRIDPKDAAVPHIPVQPLSYRDALPLLESLRGANVPSGWQGGLPLAYHTGPGPTKVRVKLEMDYQQRTIWNVIGTIAGDASPDEWVLMGNHRDAWVFGAVDPSSGTTAMLEAGRAFGELLKRGWKPRRTIKLCSWDAEEYGLIGSTEWVEERLDEIRHKAVCYLNVDVAVSGGSFSASGVPSLWAAMEAAMRDAPDATGKRSLFDNAAADEDGKNVRFGKLGGGSDFTAFLDHAGVPCFDMRMTGPYGVYHSTYDSFHWMEKFGDPDFTRHAAMARVWALLALRCADASSVLLDVRAYAEEIGKLARQLDADFKDSASKPDLSALIAASDALTAAAAAFEKAGDAPETLAKRNRIRINFERALTDDRGLPDRQWFRHVIYAPGFYTGYAAETFSGVRYSMEKKDVDGAKRAAEQVTAALKRAVQLLQ